jgi:ADP-heptose:LPS heptosyltransferase/glycosyltransferase involved in cell wall biosynthesis
MRILIDLQALQTGSRFRGIGRSAAALAKAVVRNRGNHEVFILLSGLLEDTIASIRDDFSRMLPADRVSVFSAPSPAEAMPPENAWRIEAAELIREWMINVLAPDVLLIPSLFEGPVEPGIVSIRRFETETKTAVILHDLIPYLDPERYLADPAGSKWYYSKIDSLRRAYLLLAVSDSSRREAVDALGFEPSRVVTISSAADERFTKANMSLEDAKIFLERLGIRRKFVTHTSMIEPRKNFEGLVRAFGLLSKSVRETHQLVLVGEHRPEQQIGLRRLAGDAGLAPDDLVFTGQVSDSELIALYSLCTLFVFPSFHEGFGLPPLEAMCCGAAVIGSNATSIPEVIGREDALFDPHSDQGIAELIERALTDNEFQESLRAHALRWSKRFSWDKSARLALNAIEDIAPLRSPSRASPDISILLEKIAAIKAGVSPERKDLVAVADSISKNERALSQWGTVPSGDKDDVQAEVGQPEAGKWEGHYDATFVRKLYHIFHNREPDPRGLEDHLRGLRSGRELHELVEDFLNSDEFSVRWVRRWKAPDGAADRRGGGAGPPSDPVVEVIRHRIWLRDDRPRILLLKLDHIGDFLLTVDAFRLIRDTWPNADITLVCGPWNKSIAEQLGLFNTVISCNFYPNTTTQYDKEAVTRRGLAEYRALALGSYEIAVDLRCYDDNRLCLFHTDATYRAGYAADGVELDLALPVGSESEMRAHIGARTLALAAAVAWTFGTPVGEARHGILNGRAPVRLFKDGVVVGISPGTRSLLRSWGRERFRELAQILQSRGNYRIVLIGGEADRADTQYIAEFLQKADAIDLAGTLPIADVPPIFAGLDLFIGGETGTTHMAALMGVPTLCIHSGQTNVDSWRPVGPHVVTLRGNVACSPCYLSTIEECRWNKRCMDISPACVADEVAALWDRFSTMQLSRSGRRSELQELLPSRLLDGVSRGSRKAAGA